MSNKKELGALILRLVLGAMFFIHGLEKFRGGIENTVGWFESIGLSGFMAYGVAFVELIGGLALILGVGTRIVSVFIILIMIGAILKVKLGVGLFGDGQIAGYELDLAYIAMALYLAINGSKLLSVGHLFQKRASAKR